MWGSLLDGFTGRLSERAVLQLLLPAVTFWVAVWVALSAHEETFGGGFGLASLFGRQWTWPFEQVSRFEQLDTIGQAAFALALVGASALLAELLLLWVLQLAEGYWPHDFGRLQRWCEREQQRQTQETRQALDSLKPRIRTATEEDQQRFARLEYRLQMETPLGKPQATRLGNILLAGETRPLDKYGLDPLICWARLWLILPDGPKKELGDARASLNAATRMFLWSMIGLIIVVWNLWIAGASLIAIFVAHGEMLRTAARYAKLFEAAFDMYRTPFYESLRWPLPANPIDEVTAGKKITRYLWRRERLKTPAFVTKGGGDAAGAAGATAQTPPNGPTKVAKPPTQPVTPVDSATGSVDEPQ